MGEVVWFVKRNGILVCGGGLAVAFGPMWTLEVECGLKFQFPKQQTFDL